MASRTTLPAYDPLVQLGIGLDDEEEARPVARRATRPVPKSAPAPIPVATPEKAERDFHSVPAQEVPLSRTQLPATASRPAVEPKSRTRTEAKAPAPVQTLKLKFNARVPADIADAIRNCVVALSGPPHGMTIDSFTTEALRRELQRLKKEHNRGEDFPVRAYGPKPGRPVR